MKSYLTPILLLCKLTQQQHLLLHLSLLLHQAMVAVGVEGVEPFLLLAPCESW